MSERIKRARYVNIFEENERNVTMEKRMRINQSESDRMDFLNHDNSVLASSAKIKAPEEDLLRIILGDQYEEEDDDDDDESDSDVEKKQLEVSNPWSEDRQERIDPRSNDSNAAFGQTSASQQNVEDKWWDDAISISSSQLPIQSVKRLGSPECSQRLRSSSEFDAHTSGLPVEHRGSKPPGFQAAALFPETSQTQTEDIEESEVGNNHLSNTPRDGSYSDPNTSSQSQNDESQMESQSNHDNTSAQAPRRDDFLADLEKRKDQSHIREAERQLVDALAMFSPEQTFALAMICVTFLLNSDASIDSDKYLEHSSFRRFAKDLFDRIVKSLGLSQGQEAALKIQMESIAPPPLGTTLRASQNGASRNSTTKPSVSKNQMEPAPGSLASARNSITGNGNSTNEPFTSTNPIEPLAGSAAPIGNLVDVNRNPKDPKSFHSQDLTPPSNDVPLEDTDMNEQILKECGELIGDDGYRFVASQAILVAAIQSGNYDARSRTLLLQFCRQYEVSVNSIAAVELALAIHLVDIARKLALDSLVQDMLPADFSGMTEEEKKAILKKRKKKQRYIRIAKISGVALVGGILFGVTGGLIAPALLASLAGLGLVGAASLAATGAVTSGAVVGGLFGVGGMTLAGVKARRRTRLRNTEFDFERRSDPRAILQRQQEERRQRHKEMKKLQKRKPKEKGTEEEHAELQLSVRLEENAEETVEATEFEIDGLRDEDFFKLSKRRRKKREKLELENALNMAPPSPSLHIAICIPGWLTSRKYGKCVGQFETLLDENLPCSEGLALRWDTRRLKQMGRAFAKFWASKATVSTVQQAYPHVLAASSAAVGAVAFAVAPFLTLTSLYDYIDGPWSILITRSNAAGLELADVLSDRAYGQRPVTLIGYSLGARVVFKCLETLAETRAHGIIDSAYLIGAPVTADADRWKKIRSIVANRLVNCYCTSDWALAYFHRASLNAVGASGIAGLSRIRIDRVENANVSYLGVYGHRDYQEQVPIILKAVGLAEGYLSFPPAPLRRREEQKELEEDQQKADEDEDEVEDNQELESAKELYETEKDFNKAEKKKANDATKKKSHASKGKKAVGGQVRAGDVPSSSFGVKAPSSSSDAELSYFTNEGDFAIENIEQELKDMGVVDAQSQGGEESQGNREDREDRDDHEDHKGQGENRDQQIVVPIYLPVSLEITGKRLLKLVDVGDDKASKPVVPDQESKFVFTNCENDQVAMPIRIFEGDFRYVPRKGDVSAKSLDSPRLLVEKQVKWNQKHKRGSMRFVLSCKIDKGANISIKVYARVSAENMELLCDVQISASQLISKDELAALKAKAAEDESKKKPKAEDTIDNVAMSQQMQPAPHDDGGWEEAARNMSDDEDDDDTASIVSAVNLEDVGDPEDDVSSTLTDPDLDDADGLQLSPDSKNALERSRSLHSLEEELAKDASADVETEQKPVKKKKSGWKVMFRKKKH